jgi:hypothetical protein
VKVFDMRNLPKDEADIHEEELLAITLELERLQTLLALYKAECEAAYSFIKEDDWSRPDPLTDYEIARAARLKAEQ